MTDPVPSKDRLAELIADYQLRYDQRDCKCETSDELSCKCCRRVCVCHFDFDTIAALKEIVSLREDCRRWENARNVWMAEEKRLKAQVEELSIHAEKWVKRALGGAAPEPVVEPTPRYQCMVKGCPGNHPSKWDVCDTRPYQAIAVWLDADGNFQWDFETNEDHPIDATIALARRTNWVMTDAGWRLAQSVEAKCTCPAPGTSSSSWSPFCRMHSSPPPGAGQ